MADDVAYDKGDVAVWFKNVDQSDVDTWTNHGLPRGTLGLANEGYVKIFGVRGIRTPDLPNRLCLYKVRQPLCQTLFVIKCM